MTRLEETRSGVSITTHNGCEITPRRVVIAAGFESRALLNAEAGSLKSTYAIISEPLPAISGWHRQCLIWESGTPYLYLRTTTEGRVIVGGEDVDFVNAKRRDALISQKTRTLVKKLGRLLPDQPLEVAYAGQALSAKRKTALPASVSIPGFRTPILRWVTEAMASPSASSLARSSGTISSAGQIAMPTCSVLVGESHPTSHDERRDPHAN